MGNMGSAHPLVEVNVSFKFEGNPSISIGVIERTRIGDGPTDGPTDRPTDATKRIQYSPPTFCGGGIISDSLKQYLSGTNNHANGIKSKVCKQKLSVRLHVN